MQTRVEDLTDYREMYEDQKSFLSKQNAIFKKELLRKQQQKTFEDEYIEYGQKDNKIMKDAIQKDKDNVYRYLQQTKVINEDIKAKKQKIKSLEQQLETLKMAKERRNLDPAQPSEYDMGKVAFQNSTNKQTPK